MVVLQQLTMPCRTRRVAHDVAFLNRRDTTVADEGGANYVAVVFGICLHAKEAQSLERGGRKGRPIDCSVCLLRNPWLSISKRQWHVAANAKPKVW